MFYCSHISYISNSSHQYFEFLVFYQISIFPHCICLFVEPRCFAEKYKNLWFYKPNITEKPQFVRKLVLVEPTRAFSFLNFSSIELKLCLLLRLSRALYSVARSTPVTKHPIFSLNIRTDLNCTPNTKIPLL